MKAVIISDIHGNLEALEALAESYDELWVLGDLVNYGPNPAEVVEFVKQRAAVVVRGNHDHSIGWGADPQCSAAFREMAEATRAYTDRILNAAQKAYLRDLSLSSEREVDGLRVSFCHATPSNPLYNYCRPDSEAWQREAELAGAEVLLVGHTHLPFTTEVGRTRVGNPGSLGQPKHGKPLASYAVWEDGRIELRWREYDVRETIRKVLAMPVGADVAQSLAAVLRCGGIPS